MKTPTLSPGSATLVPPVTNAQEADLLLDYGENVEQYPQLHEYFRRHQPPVLVIWGDKDPFFTPAGAEAFKRDNPNAEVRLLDSGHFAIETHGTEIAQAMLEFLRLSVTP